MKCGHNFTDLIFAHLKWRVLAVLHLAFELKNKYDLYSSFLLQSSIQHELRKHYNFESFLKSRKPWISKIKSAHKSHNNMLTISYKTVPHFSLLKRCWINSSLLSNAFSQTQIKKKLFNVNWFPNVNSNRQTLAI